MDFENLQELHNLSGHPVPVLPHPHSEKDFPALEPELPLFVFVPNASCLVTGPPGEEPGSAFFTASLRYLYTLMRSPLRLLSSVPNSPSSLSLAPGQRCSSLFIIQSSPSPGCLQHACDIQFPTENTPPTLCRPKHTHICASLRYQHRPSAHPVSLPGTWAPLPSTQVSSFSLPRPT